MAHAFDAKVSIGTSNSKGLVYVNGAPGAIEASLVSLGGQVLASLGAGKLLGAISMQGLMALQRQDGVTFAGPVSIDPARFAKFASFIGSDSATEATTAPARTSS